MSYSQDDILLGLGNIIAEETGGDPDAVTAAHTISGDLDLDSLSRLTVATHAEDTFGVTIPDEQIDTFVTVGDLADFISAAQGGGD